MNSKKGKKVSTSRKPRVAFVDIETSPNLGFVWGIWEQNVIKVEKEWHIMSFSVKYLGDKKVTTYALPDFALYKKDPENDLELVKKLWDVFDDADIVVAHNGDRFDIPKSNARFIVNKLPPPSPFKSVDTKKLAKSRFKFDSNKLDDLARYMGVGRKMETGGFSLWEGCMKGNMKSWATMKKYNAQDVVVLEAIYLKMRPWALNHPNMAVFEERVHACPRCSSENVQNRGFSVAGNGKRQRIQCQDCGAWGSVPMKLENKIQVR